MATSSTWSFSTVRPAIRSRSRSSKRPSRPTAFDFEASWRAVAPDDILTLIYTSGTTGPPKGVQLTHGNELAQCRGLDEVNHWPSGGGSIVSFLPMAHIADRGLTHYGQMAWGETLTCCPEVTQVFAHVADARPTRWGAVPRVWEKLKAALEAGIAADPDEARRGAVQAAIELGIRKVRAEQAGDEVDADLLDALRASRGAGVRADARQARPGPLRVLRDGRGAVATGGVRVLRGDRDPDLRGVGDVRADVGGDDQSAAANPLRHRRAGATGRRGHGWQTTGRCSSAGRP